LAQLDYHKPDVVFVFQSHYYKVDERASKFLLAGIGDRWKTGSPITFQAEIATALLMPSNLS